MLEAALIAGAVLALSLGYLLHRWRVLPAIAVIGIGVIAVDVSTRDLTSGGHDDRALVAFAEGVILLGAIGFFAVGVAIRHLRDRHTSPTPRQP